MLKKNIFSYFFSYIHYRSQKKKKVKRRRGSKEDKIEKIEANSGEQIQKEDFVIGNW